MSVHLVLIFSYDSGTPKDICKAGPYIQHNDIQNSVVEVSTIVCSKSQNISWLQQGLQKLRGWSGVGKAYQALTNLLDERQPES